jgi:hypothetical protein
MNQLIKGSPVHKAPAYVGFGEGSDHVAFCNPHESVNYCLKNIPKLCIHRQSGRTLPQTLRKQELHASGCPLLIHREIP